MENEKKHRRWQNLLHKKCPNCGTPMETRNLYLVCPNQNAEAPERSCFFIKRTNAIELILNKEHPAYFCLSATERDMIEETIKEL